MGEVRRGAMRAQLVGQRPANSSRGRFAAMLLKVTFSLGAYLGQLLR